MVLDSAPTDRERALHSRVISMTVHAPYHAFRTPLDSPLGRWLSAGLRRLNGEDPLLIRTSGGSIPISPFVTTLNVPAGTARTVNPDNNQHSPNENLRLGEFIRGIPTVVMVLTEPVP